MFETPYLDRRAMLARVMQLVGASATIGLSRAALAEASAGAEPSLKPADFKLLSAVADTIVPRTDTPGAIDAGVPHNVDALLRDWAAPERRAALIGALSEIDRLAVTRRKQGFAALSPGERLALLSEHDVAALKPKPREEKPTDATTGSFQSNVDPQTGKTKQVPVSAIMAGPVVANPAYAKLKELIVILYYYSEPALTHELAYVHAPGQWRPSVPVTTETRQTGGLGLF